MKILSMPAGTSAKRYFYNRGTWGYAYETPGSYTRSGTPVTVAAILSTNKYTHPVTNTAGGTALGTVSAVDLTDFSTLHAIVKGISSNASYYGFVGVTSTKELSGSVAANVISTSEYELTVDVSGLTGNYNIFTSTNPNLNMSFEVYEIWFD